MSTKNDVQELYIGLLGRAADGPGLEYWVGQIDNGVLTLEEVRSNFVNTQPEYLNGIGAMTRSQGVNQLYINLFGRVAEPEGLAYWVNGGGSEVNFDQLVFALINGAAPVDRLTLDNRDTVANAFSDSDYGSADPFDLDAARSIIADVDSTPESVNAALDLIENGEIVSGDSFTLTPQQDTIVGTSAGDSIFGFINDDVVDGTTLNSGDTIDGSGGNDTLFVTIEYESDNDLNLNMTNVEKMEIRDFDGQDFYIQNVTGLNTISIVGGDDEYTYFEDGTYIIPNIEFHNGEYNVEQDAGVVAVIPELNVLVDNADAEVYQYSDNVASRANYMMANITSTGAGYNEGQNYLYLGESQAAHTINVSGTTDIELDPEHWYGPAGAFKGSQSIQRVDASLLEAGLEIDTDFHGDGSLIGGSGDDVIDDDSENYGSEISILTGDGDDEILIDGGGATNKYTVEAGAGDDLVSIDTTNTVGHTADGGLGTDTLEVDNALVAAVNGFTDEQLAGFQASFKNFEELAVWNQLTNDVDVTDFGEDINSLTLEGGATTVLVEGLTTGAVLGIQGTSTEITVDMTDAATGPADLLNIALTSVNALTAGTVIGAGIENINIINTDPSTQAGLPFVPHDNTMTLEATSATSIIVSGNAGLNLTNTGNAKVGTFDASGVVVGNVTFVSENATTDVSLTGGAGDDTLDASAGTDDEKVATVNGGKGDDIITGGAGADVLNGEDDDDTIEGGDEADAIDGGKGDDRLQGDGGIDSLTGGAGKDTFAYAAASDSQGVTVDVIADFVSLVDMIDLSGVTLGAGTYLGEAAGYGAVLTSLTGTAGDTVLDDTTSILYVDVDGDAALTDADMAIEVAGVTVLDAADFVF